MVRDNNKKEEEERERREKEGKEKAKEIEKKMKDKEVSVSKSLTIQTSSCERRKSVKTANVSEAKPLLTVGPRLNERRGNLPREKKEDEMIVS